jgi:hypothetical protein
MPADDGSVRIVCDGTDLPVFENDPSDIRAFAFDVGGSLMMGWPIELRPGLGTVVDGELVWFSGQQLTDTPMPGIASQDVWVSTVDANGETRSGTRVPVEESVGYGEWAIGPDGTAYGVAAVGDGTEGAAEMSRVTALDASGLREGWPVDVDGVASEPAFSPSGGIVMTVALPARGTSRVLVLNRDGRANLVSAELPIATAEIGVDCFVAAPEAPIVADQSTVALTSAIETTVYALDQTLAISPGWPFELPAPIERPDPWRGQEGINCTSLARATMDPYGAIYLPLQARDATVGGSIVAIDSDGRVRPGWPVELTRPAAEFWAVEAGFDGTAYALAVEPEPGGTSSATILAIGRDSTILYATTIIEPP